MQSRIHDIPNEMRQRDNSLDPILRPNNIAVIGATEKVGSVGRTIIWNLISNPFGGTIYPVNPKRANILGIKAYPSIGDIPDQIDLAVIITPVPTVPGLVKECVEAGIPGAIIISASGMCDAGRIRHHLKNNLWRANATVLLIGYMAPGTLGALLEAGERRVRIQGDEIAVKARIRKLEIYSGHADHDELLDWLRDRLPIRRGLFLTHGELDAAASLRAAIAGWKEELPAITIPHIDESYRLDGRRPVRIPPDGAPRRLDRYAEAEALAGHDWHNDYARLMLDVQRRLRGMEDDVARKRLMRKLRFAELIFPRQWARGEYLQLPETDRISVLLECLASYPVCSSLWLEVLDTNDGKELSNFCRKFEAPLRKALIKAGRLDEQGRIGLHVIDEDDRIAFLPVEIIRARADGVWVTGLPERARIVTISQGMLSPGQRVEVRETPEEYLTWSGPVGAAIEAAEDLLEEEAPADDAVPGAGEAR